MNYDMSNNQSGLNNCPCVNAWVNEQVWTYDHIGLIGMQDVIQKLKHDRKIQDIKKLYNLSDDWCRFISNVETTDSIEHLEQLETNYQYSFRKYPYRVVTSLRTHE